MIDDAAALSAAWYRARDANERTHMTQTMTEREAAIIELRAFLKPGAMITWIELPDREEADFAPLAVRNEPLSVPTIEPIGSAVRLVLGEERYPTWRKTREAELGPLTEALGNALYGDPGAFNWEVI